MTIGARICFALHVVTFVTLATVGPHLGATQELEHGTLGLYARTSLWRW